MTPGALYLVAVALWLVGAVAWGVYFAWDTKDIIALTLFGGAFLPFAVAALVAVGAFNALYHGVDRLNTAVQNRRLVRAAIEREIAEWLR